jgi:hypothetical protein
MSVNSSGFNLGRSLKLNALRGMAERMAEQYGR